MNFWLKQTHPHAEINVQRVLNCTPKTYGCRGGLMEHAFEYSYPLYDETGVCTPSKQVQFDFVSVDRNIEYSLAYMIHTWGPVTLALDLTHQNNYTGGILKAKKCESFAKDAVLAVGYTPEYWIIQNSIGDKWGDGGYAYIERGTIACGIETYASVVTGITIDEISPARIAPDHPVHSPPDQDSQEARTETQHPSAERTLL